jgi:hypothetical protein
MTLRCWRHDSQRPPNEAVLLPWFPLVVLACLFPLSAGAQTCRGNPSVGCISPGAACTGANVPHGRCTTVEGLPRGERACACEGPPAPPRPPLILRPKYIVGAVVYAPPGCLSTTPPSACSQPGLVDYSSGSSMGSKITVADSFKNGVKVTASLGTPLGGGDASFGWSRTTGDTSFANLTKSGSLEIKVPGNGDGVNHDQDMIELLLNPTVTLSTDGGTNIFWQPGYAGDAVARYEVYVSELRNPATMRPDVASVLTKLGLTAADYKTIRCLDQFAGPGVSGRGGIRPDFCQMAASTGEPSAGLDLNRFRPTSWILPYEPPVHATDLCPSITATLKNEYSSEDAKSTQDEYSVSADMSVGVKDLWGVKIEGTMTWTTGETDTSSHGSTQTAALTLVCPSVGYTGPTLFQVFWDVLYGTFLFMPYDPSTMEITQRGVVTDHQGKPLAGSPIDLVYGGHTYHTFATSTGHYRFIGLKRLSNPAIQKGTISVRNVKRQVTLRSQSSSTVKLP